MATPPKISKRLHNFSLPCLKWGDQRFLRCIKVPPNSQPSSLHPRSSPKVRQSHPEPNPKTDIPNKYGRNPIRNTEPESNSHQETNMIRQTLSLDIGVATKSKKLRLSVLEGEDRNSCPWNLRTRRAACTAPKEEKNIESGSPSQIKDGCNAEAKAKTKYNIGFAVRLLKDEVEEDFLKMVERDRRRGRRKGLGLSRGNWIQIFRACGSRRLQLIHTKFLFLNEERRFWTLYYPVETEL